MAKPRNNSSSFFSIEELSNSATGRLIAICLGESTNASGMVNLIPAGGFL